MPIMTQTMNKPIVLNSELNKHLLFLRESCWPTRPLSQNQKHSFWITTKLVSEVEGERMLCFYAIYPL